SAARINIWDLQIQDSNRSLKSFFASVHPEDQPKLMNAIDRTIEKGGIFEVEFRVRRPNNEILWQLVKGEVRFDNQGKPEQILGANVDITERKIAEEERREAEEMLHAHRQELYHLSRVGILGELSGTLAHELNQPLTAILSNAQAAQRF